MESVISKSCLLTGRRLVGSLTFGRFFAQSFTFDFMYWEEDWCWCAKQFLQVQPAELAMMRMFDKDMAL
jgi:hypothetical protein